MADSYGRTMGTVTDFTCSDWSEVPVLPARFRRTAWKRVLTAVCAGAVIAISLSERLGAAELSQAGPAAHSAPRCFDLARLRELEAPDLSPKQRAKLGLHFYRDEAVHPTPNVWPPFSDLRRHDYMLAQITHKLVEVGADVSVLASYRAKMLPSETRDCLGMLLLLRGSDDPHAEVEACVTGPLAAMRVRELGVEALGEYAVRKRDASLVPAFAELIRTNNQVWFVLPDKPGPDGKRHVRETFPVKVVAQNALRKLQAVGVQLPADIEALVTRRTEIVLPEDHLNIGKTPPGAAPLQRGPVRQPAR